MRIIIFFSLSVWIAFVGFRSAHAADPVVSDINFFGRLVADYASLSGENTDFTLNDGSLRTARLGLEGKIFSRGKFKAELATGSTGDVLLTDAYASIDLNGSAAVLRAGQFKTTNGFEEKASGRHTSFQERTPFTDAFDIDRRLGVELLGKGSRYTYAIGIFGNNLQDANRFGSYALAGRTTYEPIQRDDTVVHIGASARYRDVGRSDPLLQYQQSPVSGLAGNILSTGSIGESDIFAGIELALTKGRFFAASEYAVSFVDCPACSENPDFSGGYVEAGFSIAGRRPIRDGKFQRPELDGSRLGAASFVFRIDTIDLSSSDIDGGSYNAYRLGADWWPVAYARISVNGFIANADLGTQLPGLDTAFQDAIRAGVTDETVKGLTVRWQLDF